MPLASALIVACGAPVVTHADPLVKADTSPKSTSVNLRIPDSVDGFQLSDQYKYEDPALGYRLRYEGQDSMYADVFVFPGPILDGSCDRAEAIQALNDQVAGFREGFSEMIARHYVDSIVVTHDEILDPKAETPWCLGRHLTLSVVRDSIPQRSDFYLYSLSGYFVKVRVTYPFTPQRLSLEDEFIHTLFSALIPR